MRRQEPCLNTGTFADAAVGNTQDLSQASGYIPCMAGILRREDATSATCTVHSKNTDYGATPGKS